MRNIMFLEVLWGLGKDLEVREYSQTILEVNIGNCKVVVNHGQRKVTILAYGNMQEAIEVMKKIDAVTQGHYILEIVPRW